MIRFSKRSRVVSLGIDISSYSVEMLALSPEKDVMAYERMVLDDGIIVNGVIQRERVFYTKLDALLAKIISRTGALQNARVTVNVPEQHTYVHYFNAPANLSGAHLVTYLRDEAAKIIPLETHDITGTYQILERGKTTQRVLFVATRKDITQGLLRALHAVGLDASTLDIESLALARSLLPASGMQEPMLVIDSGAETSAIHIFESCSFPVVSAAYPEGGVQNTKRIAEALQVSFDEAEKLKLAFGLAKAPLPSMETALQEEKESSAIPKEVSLILHDFFQHLFADAQKIIGFYEAERKKRVSAVILAGGTALLPHIVPYSTAYIGRPVRIGNPLMSIRKSEILGKEKPSIIYATVIGLALRGSDSSLPSVDLTHGVIMEETQISQKRWGRTRVIVMGICIMAIAALFFYGILFFFMGATVYQY